MRKMMLAVMLVALVAGMATVPFGAEATTYYSTAIDSPGAPGNEGNLSNWLITYSALKVGKNFTISGTYTSGLPYSDQSFVAIEGNFIRWNPADETYLGGVYTFAIQGTFTTAGRHLIQVFFEQNQTNDQSYVEKYINIEPGTGGDGGQIWTPYINAAVNYWPWLIVMVLLIIGAGLIPYAPIRFACVMAAVAIFILILMAKMPTVDETIAWFEGLV